jgi:hypothetical protein
MTDEQKKRVEEIQGRIDKHRKLFAADDQDALHALNAIKTSAREDLMALLDIVDQQASTISEQAKEIEALKRARDGHCDLNTELQSALSKLLDGLEIIAAELYSGPECAKRARDLLRENGRLP